jgi:hypothetical protein
MVGGCPSRPGSSRRSSGGARSAGDRNTSGTVRRRSISSWATATSSRCSAPRSCAFASSGLARGVLRMGRIFREATPVASPGSPGSEFVEQLDAGEQPDAGDRRDRDVHVAPELDQATPAIRSTPPSPTPWPRAIASMSAGNESSQSSVGPIARWSNRCDNTPHFVVTDNAPLKPQGVGMQDTEAICRLIEEWRSQDRPLFLVDEVREHDIVSFVLLVGQQPARNTVRRQRLPAARANARGRRTSPNQGGAPLRRSETSTRRAASPRSRRCRAIQRRSLHHLFAGVEAIRSAGPRMAPAGRERGRSTDGADPWQGVSATAERAQSCSSVARSGRSAGRRATRPLGATWSRSPSARTAFAQHHDVLSCTERNAIVDVLVPSPGRDAAQRTSNTPVAWAESVTCAAVPVSSTAAPGVA